LIQFKDYLSGRKEERNWANIYRHGNKLNGSRKLSAYAEFFEDTVKDKEENDLRINILELADFMKETISTFKLIQFGKREFSREEIVQKNERLRKEYNELLEKKIRPTYKELEKQLGVD
jgi:hypothetical protein